MRKIAYGKITCGTLNTSVLILSIALSGCKTMAENQDTQAVITAHTKASHAELETVFTQALHGVKPTLAKDAFIKESKLIIEQGQKQTLSGNHSNGRIMENPHHFSLVLTQGQCYVIDEKSGKRYPLSKASCQAK